MEVILLPVEVKEENAYDEPIYEEQDVYEWHSMWTDGSYADEFRDKEVMFVCTYNDET